MSKLVSELSDLEQKIFRQESVINEVCDSVLYLLEGSDSASAELCDRVSNLVLGLKQQVEISTSMISDDINRVIKDNSGQLLGYTSTISEDGVLQLPQQFLDELGWKEGDLLDCRLLPGKGLKLSKVERYAF